MGNDWLIIDSEFVKDRTIESRTIYQEFRTRDTLSGAGRLNARQIQRVAQALKNLSAVSGCSFQDIKKDAEKL